MQYATFSTCFISFNNSEVIIIFLFQMWELRLGQELSQSDTKSPNGSRSSQASKLVFQWRDVSQSLHLLIYPSLSKTCVNVIYCQ